MKLILSLLAALLLADCAAFIPLAEVAIDAGATVAEDELARHEAEQQNRVAAPQIGTPTRRDAGSDLIEPGDLLESTP